jgi:hypothetical protein
MIISFTFRGKGLLILFCLVMMGCSNGTADPAINAAAGEGQLIIFSAASPD